MASLILQKNMFYDLKNMFYGRTDLADTDLGEHLVDLLF